MKMVVNGVEKEVERVRIVNSGEPLTFSVRESRAVELASELRRLGCEVTSPAADTSRPAADLHSHSS